MPVTIDKEFIIYENGTKKCSKCFKIKHKSEYHSRDTRFGFYNYCKECHRAMNRDNGYLRKYGISYAKFIEMVKQQEGKCAICDKHKELHLDHDHKTGQIRQLLCQNCNAILGQCFETEEILLKVISYLRLHK